MTRHQLERIYGMRELTRILTLTPRRTAQLRRLELLHGESGYTFRDLLALRAASALLDAGASVRQIRQALAALRRQDPRLEQPLAALKLVPGADPRAREAGYHVGRLPGARGFTAAATADYRRALEVSPAYADAHFTLAGALVRVERGAEAVRHWQRYLELDAGSPWARIARAHLELVEPPDESPWPRGPVE